MIENLIEWIMNNPLISFAIAAIIAVIIVIIKGSKK